MTDSQDRVLGRIEGKLDAVLERIGEQQNRLNNHGDRLGRLERWQAKLLGMAAVIAIIATYAAKLVMN